MTDLVGGHTGQPQPHPRLRTEFGYLTLCVVGATVTAVLFAVDHSTHLDMRPGAYAVTAALAGIGACGWIVRVGDARHRRDQAEILIALVELTGAVEQLRKTLRQRDPRPRIVESCSPTGHLYASASAIGDIAARSAAAVDADTATGIRVVRHVDTEAARTQGYAEGYVDGIARRDDGDGPRMN